MQEPKSIFIDTFGDYPALRIIDFLIESRMFDYPITEIAKNSDVHFLTFKKIWPEFIKKGFVKKTRRVGNSDLYRINEENLVIKKFIEVGNFLAKQAAREAVKRADEKKTRKVLASAKH